MCETLDQVCYEVVSLAELHGSDLRDAVLVAIAREIFIIHFFDGHFEACDFVLAKIYRVARAFTDDMAEFVLVKLSFEALRGEHCHHCRLARKPCLKEG